MDRLHCSYPELLATPVSVVEDVLLVMEAEAKAADAQRADAEREAQRGR